MTAFQPSAILLLTLGVVCAAAIFNVAQPIDNRLNAMKMRLLERAPSQTLSIVEIDSESLASEGVWPWPRERFAEALQKLDAAGAGFVGFDVDFSAASTPSGDDAFAAALDRRPGFTILPTFAQRDARRENVPAARFASSSVLGSVSIPVDPDGVVRHYARGYVREHAYRSSIASVLSNGAEGDASRFLIDFGVRADAIPRIRFMDLLSGEFDPALVRGRSILIGATAVELSDDYPVSTRPSMPGVVIHALAYENLVQARALATSSIWLELAGALLCLLALWPRRRPLNVAALVWRHVAFVGGGLLVSVLIQAVSPLSIGLGLVLLTQVLALVAAVHRELERRRLEIILQREAHQAHLAEHDPETGVPNRRALLNSWADHTASESAWVLAIGIDRAEILRGAIGYVNASTVLANLATRLGERWGTTSVFQLSSSVLCIARRGEAPPPDLLEALDVRVDTRFSVEGQYVDLALRGGLASGERPLPDLLEKAALALDHARLHALSCKLHCDDDGQDPLQQLAILSGVKRAVADNEFRLAYQPKVSASGALIGAEALIRWRHPEQGELPPSKFIPLSEELGSIGLITRWTVRRALRDWIDLASQGIEIPISVNLSGKLLRDKDLITWIIHAVQDAGAQIKIELTETALLGESDNVGPSIDDFRNAGIQVSIDDYGAGLSTLNYLKTIRADELKLDRSLIIDIHDPRDQTIIASTIGLAHALGMVVIAEGIEDIETHRILCGLGCDGFQGYLFGRPAPLHSLVEYYSRAVERHGNLRGAA